MARIALDRARIARAAMTLLDERGIEALTARGIAARLDVQASALYYHLPDMRALMDELATAMLREMVAPGLAEDRWEPLLRAMGDRTRSVLLQHRDGARVFAGSRVTDASLLSFMEQPLAVLTGAGLPLGEAFWTLQSVLHYTVGFVIEEQHRSDDEPEAYRAEARAAQIDPAAPLTAAASAPMMADPDGRFVFGLDLLVAGVRARIAG